MSKRKTGTVTQNLPSPEVMRKYAGVRFGKWTVVSFHSRTPKDNRWLCRCDCGNVRIVGSHNLRNGHSKSCGCLVKDVQSARMTKHGKSRTRAYRAWKSMIHRCTLPYDERWNNYGARGISVCDKWKDFEGFYEDMGDPPAGLSLDRIDNNGNYTPENCRWATILEQARNKRTSTNLNFRGRELSIRNWAREIGMSPSTLTQRIARGWSVERALTTPSDTKRHPGKHHERS